MAMTPLALPPGVRPSTCCPPIITTGRGINIVVPRREGPAAQPRAATLLHGPALGTLAGSRTD